MKNYFVLVFLICTSFLVQGQNFDDDYNIHQEVLGYIINIDGDTIIGKIKVQTRVKNQIKVKFISKDGKSKTFKPKHLIGYGYRTGSPQPTCHPYRYRHFLRRTAEQRPMPFSSKTVFMKVKAAGRANLYSYYIQNNETKNLDNKYLHYYYLEFEDGTRARKITQDDFDWAVPNFLEDCRFSWF